MSDALTDIARDERKSRILYQIKNLVDEGKNENDNEIKILIDEVTSIPRGYYSGRHKKEDIMEWIKTERTMGKL